MFLICLLASFVDHCERHTVTANARRYRTIVHSKSDTRAEEKNNFWHSYTCLPGKSFELAQCNSICFRTQNVWNALCSWIHNDDNIHTSIRSVFTSIFFSFYALYKRKNTLNTYSVDVHILQMYIFVYNEIRL